MLTVYEYKLNDYHYFYQVMECFVIFNRLVLSTNWSFGYRIILTPLRKTANVWKIINLELLLDIICN